MMRPRTASTPRPTPTHIFSRQLARILSHRNCSCFLRNRNTAWTDKPIQSGRCRSQRSLNQQGRDQCRLKTILPTIKGSLSLGAIRHVSPNLAIHPDNSDFNPELCRSRVSRNLPRLGKICFRRFNFFMTRPQFNPDIARR